MNNNHYQLLKYCIDNNNIKLWNEIKKECDEHGIKIDLKDVYLLNKNLTDIDLSNVNLYDADFRWSNFKNANLRGSNLQWVNFQYSILERVNFYNANLLNADLLNVNLSCSNLEYLILSKMNYQIIMVKNQIQIGCEIHSLKEWENFTDMEINEMYKDALDWWKQNKEMIIYMYKNFEKLNTLYK